MQCQQEQGNKTDVNDSGSEVVELQRRVVLSITL